MEKVKSVVAHPHNEVMEKAMHQKEKKQKHKKHSSRLERVPAPMTQNKVYTFSQAVRNFLSSSLQSNKSLKNVMATMKLQDPQKHTMTKKYLRGVGREIFGTWEPVHKFHRVSGAAVIGAAGVLLSVVTISNQDCALYDEFEAVFDEVQPVGPFHVTFRSIVTSTAHEWATGVLDYDNSTALASVEGALSYDTAKIFILNPYFTGSESLVTWDGHIQGYPDKDWTDVSAVNAYAYWKAYNYVALTGSTTYGYIDFVLPLRFRQVGSGT